MPNDRHTRATLDTVHQQAKRLTRLVDIPLAYAKEALARGPYQCARWSDLISRIENHGLTSPLPSLAQEALDPKAQEAFGQIADTLFASIASQINIADDGPLWRRQVMRKVFTDWDTPVTLEQIFTKGAIPSWSPANIGPDSRAVLMATDVIEGRTFNLIAVRTFELSVYFEDRKKFGISTIAFKRNGPDIVWENPELWEKAARRFTSDEDDSLKFETPRQRLNGAMMEFATWFSETLEHIYDHHPCQDDEAELLPLWLDGWPYLVFGFPDETTPPPAPHRLQAQPTGADAPNTILLIGGTPVCLEEASTARFQPWPTLRTTRETASPSPRHHSNHFIRPATVTDVREYKRQPPNDAPEPPKPLIRWTLSASNVFLTQQLITKVAMNDLSSGGSGWPIVKLRKMPADDSNHELLSLFLKLEHGEDWFSINLIGLSHSGPDADGPHSYEVNPVLHELIRAVGKKGIRRAITGRWIGNEEIVFDIVKSALPKNWH